MLSRPSLTTTVASHERAIFLRFIITGSSGFVGRHVCAALRDGGHDVTGVTRARIAAGRPDICIDLLQPGAAADLFKAARADRLVHLAWTVEHGKFWTDPKNLDWVAATLSLAQAAHEAGVKHITVTGTCYEYNWPTSGDCIEDNTPTASHTLYDTAKDATHRILSAHARQMGYGLAWARLFNLYGAGEHPDRLVASVARALAEGRRAQTSRGVPVRDFMDVRDAGRAIAEVAVAGFTGAVNTATGEPVRICDVVRRLGELSGRSELIALGSLPDRPEPPRITADVAALRKLGFSPLYSLDRGLSDAIDFWRRRSK